MLLTREVRFFLETDEESDPLAGDMPPNTWAGWPTAAGLGPYLCVRATVAGQPNAMTGYLCDIREIDDLLQATAVPLARKMMREATARLSAERLLAAIWQRVPEEIFPGVRLLRLELLVSPYLRFAIQRDGTNMIQYTEQFEFSAAHRLHCATLTEEQNREIFGKCNNPKGHGHNYVVEVTVSADVGEVPVSRGRLARTVKEQVLDRFDHRHLNEDTVEFRQLNPTVENISHVIWHLLADALKPARLLAVRVYETPKTWAEVRGE